MTAAGGDSSSPPYGFSDDADTRRLLRTRPAPEALAWAAAQVGATSVTRVRVLRGGMSSAMHVLSVDGGDARGERLVLRRYVRPDLNIEEPDIATREATALRFVEPLGLPTPRLLGCDLTGAYAGVPALVMSRVPGRIDWAPTDIDCWLSRLVDLLPAIHAAPLPTPAAIPRYAPYAQRSYDPPGWARDPATWERAVELFHGPVVDRTAPVFVHRDFHPGNVLWRRQKVSGLVDWQSASFGPASVDVGHCRANLLRYGVEVAERFTRQWERTTGRAYHPWADIVTLVGCLDNLRDPPPSNRHAIEQVLSQATAELQRGWR